MALFYDRAEISGRAKITREGYFVADALVARANNIQAYTAGELGITDRAPNDVVRVFRPEASVFAVDSLKSASRLPITLGHPVKDGHGVMVDATNWREFAKGESGEEIMRDGEFMRVPIRVTDAEAVETVQRDHREFSLGYSASLDMTPGTFNGEAYDASLVGIKYNHLAACRAARGGPELRITDERSEQTGVQPVTIAIVDGLPVNLADATIAKGVVEKLIADRDAAVVDNKAHLTTIAARDATIATLEGDKTRLTDELAAATLTPAKLRDAAAAYGRTVENAKKLGATVTDEMDEAAIKQAAVIAKLGDAAKVYNDDQFTAAFDTLVAAMGDGETGATRGDALSGVIADAQNVTDARTAFADARAKRFQRFGSAYREPATSTGA